MAMKQNRTPSMAMKQNRILSIHYISVQNLNF